MAELPENLQGQVQAHCDKGDDLADDGKYTEAIAQYQAAWQLLPQPRTKWKASTWVLGAMGDAQFLAGDYVGGRDSMALAMDCPGAVGDPIMHLRFGQCEFEMGNFTIAAEELMKAYEEAGSKIFDDEGDKYFDFLKTQMQEPPGGW
jgi:tetratricopeptide (TPR) repeat protein